MKIWNSGLTGFDSAAMLKEVFGGYTGTDIVKSHVTSNAAVTGGTMPSSSASGSVSH